MKIIQLTAENVKKIKAVTIRPDGSLIVIGGRNAQGKSSVLDSIMAALGGRDYCPEKPLRDGQKKGFVEVEMEDLTVRRTFTKGGGGTLIVSNKDGARYPSPQAMLDKLTGKISFDPLSFASAKDKEQLEMLRKLVGVDLESFNERYSKVYAERTEINREAVSLKGRVEGIAVPEDVPEELVSVEELLSTRKEMDNANMSFGVDQQALGATRESIKRNRKFIKGLQEDIEKAEKVIKKFQKVEEKAEKALEGREAKDLSHIDTAIASAEEKNIAFRNKEQREKLVRELKGKEKLSRGRTQLLEDILGEKRSVIEEAKLPIKGLGFDDTGVTYQGVPFSQASDAEQLRVSVALGIAMNPKLKVLLVRNGSLLDEENLKLVGEMAEKAEAQVWMERVGTGAEMSVIMEDGEVKDE